MPNQRKTVSVLSQRRQRSNDRMECQWRRLDNLWQAEDEPRRYSNKEVEKAKRITQQFGPRVPLVTSGDGRVLGHFVVVLAARELRLEEYPTVSADDLSSIEQDALSLALGSLYELGKFNQRLLGMRLAKLEIELPTMSFESIGLDTAETDRAFSVLTDRSEAEPRAAAGPPVSKAGDLWKLGRHRVGCGDAADADWVEALMVGNTASMAFTDMPYGCKVLIFPRFDGHR